MGAMRPWHWIVVLVVVLLLFGANKLPELAGSIGKSMKVFKKEVKELREDDDTPAAQPPAQIQPQQGTYYTEPTQPGQAAPAQPVNPQDGAAPQA
ncbi:Sec-independent protein translocase protein TatA [Actinomyces bovis]|uniref:Sec-independent protein translocase protein TatA n=1 Tax=Actinomyces bovis TaxID=1658 RepID=A0ABY1VQS0_9ACTO|nr:Sec-independent protein translocase subunit TatA [Actinomyces bovis]SPT54017.1 Sec-independent protein translocase protein TatA [Actinomyces bovis]VEG53848.1 Sec-independent protein translocase protein TatA [Actinomyces israelii]